MTSKRLEQYKKLVGNFKAAREIGFKIPGYADWPDICMKNSSQLADALGDVLARLEIAEEALTSIFKNESTNLGEPLSGAGVDAKEALAKILSDEEVK